MDPLSLAMLFGSIGLQYFNNSATNKKSEELRQKQNEAQRAAAVHDFKRMRRLQEQSAKLSYELEAELHKQRMEEVENNYDTVLKQIAHNTAINSWPLTVLPFVMRGESFGNLMGGSTKSLALHCIVTPSNYDLYNQYFYDDIDLRLEEKMNSIWNAQSNHPVVYYGGCWRKRDLKGTVSCVSLNEIDLLKSQLKSLPTLVITPYFDPKLHFRIKMWGMGKDAEVRLDLRGDMFNFIDCYEEGHFPEGELLNSFYTTTINQMVPYLQSLIGFVADKYFWSMYGVKPMLPEIAQHQAMTRLIFKEKLFPIYKKTLDEELHQKEDYIRAIDFVDGLSKAMTSEEKCQMFSGLYNSYVYKQGGKNELDTHDLKFLCNIQPLLSSVGMADNVSQHIAAIHADEDVRVWFCANKNEFYQRIINEGEKFIKIPSQFIVEYRTDFYAIGCFANNNLDEPEYSEEGVAYYVVLLANRSGECCITIDVETLQETEIANTGLFNSITFDEHYLKDIFTAQCNWLNGLCEMTESSSYLLIDQLEGAPVINFTYQNLRDWIEENACQSGEANVVMGFRRSLGRYFFIVSGSACTDILACYCNTIDDTMRDKFNNKHILTIKVN